MYKPSHLPSHLISLKPIGTEVAVVIGTWFNIPLELLMRDEMVDCETDFS